MASFTPHDHAATMLLLISHHRVLRRTAWIAESVKVGGEMAHFRVRADLYVQLVQERFQIWNGARNGHVVVEIHRPADETVISSRQAPLVFVVAVRSERAEAV